MNKEIPSDILIILIWTISAFIFIMIPELNDSIIRTILGIPMVLFIPGYVLIAALFPKKKDLDSMERIALSFGMSITMVPLIGLLLNYTFGIRLIPLIITLCIYILALTITTIYRRRKLVENVQFSVQFSKIYDVINNEINASKNKTDKILTVLLIFTMLWAIVMVIYVITTPKIGEKFTEFYILNSTIRKADNYTTKLGVNTDTTLLVGVINHEYSTVNYTIQIDLDKNILTLQELTLDNNDKWEKNITFIPDKKGSDMKLEFLLFKEDNFSIPYRELHLWVNIT